MQLIRDLIIISVVIAGFVNCASVINSHYHSAISSERVRCVESHREANWLHIEFQSEPHAENWCDDHEDNWRSLVNGRVSAAAAKIDAELDNH